MNLNNLTKLLQHCDYSAEVRENNVFVTNEDVNEIFIFKNDIIESPTSNVDELIDIIFNCAIEYEKHNEFLQFCITFLNKNVIYNSDISLLQFIDKVESCIAFCKSRNKKKLINYLHNLYEM